MDPLSLTVNVVALIQLASSCLKLSRKFVGPSEFSSSDLTSIVTALYGFTGAVKTFETHLEIYEDDEARLISLEYLKPALKQCEEALNIIKNFVEKSNFIGKHFIGPKFDRKLKISLKALDGAKELLTLALQADQRTILHGVERYIRNVAEDLRDLHDLVKSNEKKLDGLNKEQIERFKQTYTWHVGIVTSLKRLHMDGDATLKEVKKVGREQSNSHRETILDWLTPINYAGQQSDLINRRQAGTGAWLLASTEFQTWVDTGKQTLFCPGIPGAGKTILTSIVVDELNKKYHNNTSVGIAYVYCNFQRQGEQKALDLLTNLLKQLAQRQPSLPSSVEDLHHQHKARHTRPSLDDISRALRSVGALYSRVFIIVDALDECQTANNCRSKLLCEIFSFQAKTEANFFATSRPAPHIEREFSGCMSIEITASNEDVCRYLDSRMLQLPAFVLKRPDLQEEIKTKITPAVEGMFLLAQLYLDSLQDKTSVREVKGALNKLQKQNQGRSTQSNKLEVLAQAYTHAMERINQQKPGFRLLANKVLSWITCVKRQLTAPELQHALAVTIGDHELDKENLREISDIVSVCAGLVIVDKESDIIRLVHYTTQEYFEETRKEWFPNAETDITLICVTYLSFNVFTTGFCQTDDEFQERLRSYKLYDYSARNWGHHARNVLPLCEVIMDFLECEAKVEASSQAVHACKGESQTIPRNVIGLHVATYFGLEAAVYALLSRGYGPNSEDTYGWTPLFWAVDKGHETIVKALLSTGAVDINLKDKTIFCRTPLLLAADTGNPSAVKLLLDNGAELESRDSEYDSTPILWASWKGHEGVVGLLLESGGDLEARNFLSSSPLSLAAESGHDAVVTLLLEKGAELEVEDSFGQTPLLLAALGGHTAVVELLLEEGAEDTVFNLAYPFFRYDLGKARLSSRVRRRGKAKDRLALKMDRKEEKGMKKKA
ncbi:hypothetical protein G7Y89_g11882 [Cudoniella acicularis]|uniref:NACHT domain-containing protein n=1 Tax=Cudoniella acicularis TaxID=354080 RepID=A0A8H4W079_9HELO|nr:hypothetical protein G7Y89_g11882 [Cudoniella acicularis]